MIYEGCEGGQTPRSVFETLSLTAHERVDALEANAPTPEDSIPPNLFASGSCTGDIDKVCNQWLDIDNDNVPSADNIPYQSADIGHQHWECQVVSFIFAAIKVNAFQMKG